MINIDVKKCASLLKEYDNYLILSHRHPDGDTLGSAFALKRALDLLGKKSMVRCNDEMADKFSYLWQNLDNSEIKFDKIIAVDVADKKLLGEDFETKYGDNVFLCIDHHMSNREYAENLLLEDRAAAAVVIYEVICQLGVEITPELLFDNGIVKQVENGGVKILGNGEVTKAFTVKANAFSKSAQAKIEAAGGRVEGI